MCVARGEAIAASDQYSLGMVCYEMLGGRGAIGAVNASDSTVDQVRDTAPSIGPVNRSLPKGLEGVVVRMLSPRAADRWRSAAELSAAFAVIPVVPSERAREQLVERIARVRHRRVVQEMLRGLGPTSMQVGIAAHAPAPETGVTDTVVDEEADALTIARRPPGWTQFGALRYAVIVALSAIGLWLSLRRR